MAEDDYPWREPKDLVTLLGRSAAGFWCRWASLRKPAAAARSRRSPPLRNARRDPSLTTSARFYRSMRPTELFAPGTRKEFGFYTIRSNNLMGKSMEDAEPAEDWVGAQGLFLGQSQGGDPFWWAEGHRTAPDGSIFLLDHEGHLSEAVMFAHFARSFREFLGKLAHFKSLDSTPHDKLFRREYLELNPSVKS